MVKIIKDNRILIQENSEGPFNVILFTNLC